MMSFDQWTSIEGGKFFGVTPLYKELKITARGELAFPLNEDS